MTMNFNISKGKIYKIVGIFFRQGENPALYPMKISYPNRTDLRIASFDISYRFIVRFLMIKSFSDMRTAAIFAGSAVRGLSAQVQKRTRAKLLVLDAATQLHDLRVPPSNYLRALRGDRRGEHGIRVDDQLRICFLWRNGESWKVEIVDEH